MSVLMSNVDVDDDVDIGCRMSMLTSDVDIGADVDVGVGVDVQVEVATKQGCVNTQPKRQRKTQEPNFRMRTGEQNEHDKKK